MPGRCTVAGGGEWLPKGMMQTTLAGLMLYSVEGVEMGTLQHICDQIHTSKKLDPEFSAEQIGQQPTIVNAIVKFVPGCFLVDASGKRHLVESMKVSVEYRYVVTEPKMDFRTFRDAQVAGTQSESSDVDTLLTIIKQKEEKFRGCHN